MARPRSKPSKTTRTDELKNLSSEVLRLRLQNLNLPITGSRARLLERLRLATNSAPAATLRHTRGRLQNGRVRKNTPSASNVRVRPRPQPNIPTEQADAETHSSDEDGRSDVDSAADELLEDFEPEVLHDSVFSPAQMSAIQETVSTSVTEALRVFQNHEARSDDLRTPSPRTLNTATPLGLHRPLEKSLEDKILRGEYIDFCLLLPDFMYRSQAPALQLRYEDSSPGSQGSPLTLVRRKKPVIDTFQKWLDAFTAYMLVIVAVHPTRSLELIKYQQTISKAVTKFKGLAWLTYDEQFRRRAAYDLSKAWDKIDLELWTVTFSGLAKPHCSVCSSPYHQAEDCPNQDPSRKPRRQAMVCFDFNKPSGCQRLSCHFPHNCRRCGSGNHALFNCPGPKPSGSSHRPVNPSDRSKK